MDMSYIEPKRSVIDMMYSMIQKGMVSKPLLGCRMHNCRVHTHKVNTTTDPKSPTLPTKANK